LLLVPIAAFLAGSLLTLLLPVALLIALVVWYWLFSVRVPNTTGGSEPGTAPDEGNPAPRAPSETSQPARGA
jgi:hypothetical protein